MRHLMFFFFFYGLSKIKPLSQILLACITFCIKYIAALSCAIIVNQSI